MKPNQKNRYNGRYNGNRNFRPQSISRNTPFDSNGPAGKLHGTALQLFEKYQAAAKDAQIQNDSVLAETCLQYADHYARLQGIAIANEEASRATYQQQRLQRVEQQVQTAPVNDELPDFGLPDSESLASLPTDELSEEDKALKRMDLSIPISAIQEKHNDAPAAKSGQPHRRPHRPYKKKEETAV